RKIPTAISASLGRKLESFDWLYHICKTGIANRLETECGNHHVHDLAAFFFYLNFCRNLAIFSITFLPPI
ncbi:hypothetical protein ABKU77_22145, partial (plasmid) [Enterobacter kobei]|uniref:hypothetical protein n=1 Tax=Enterobacter kobei TaxID=208224 RepID=UPI0032AFD67F